MSDVNVKVEGHRQSVNHGANVNYYRTARGLSQEYVAQHIEISLPQYSDLEKQGFIEEETLKKIADLLRIGLEWLKEIPATKVSAVFYQDGSGFYCSNIGDVNHTIVKPVEEVVACYDKLLERVDRIVEGLQDQLAKERERSDYERNKREEFIARISDMLIKKNNGYPDSSPST